MQSDTRWIMNVPVLQAQDEEEQDEEEQDEEEQDEEKPAVPLEESAPPEMPDLEMEPEESPAHTPIDILKDIMRNG